MDADDRPQLMIGASWPDYVRFRDGGDPPGHRAAICWVLDAERRAMLLVRHRVYGWSCAGGHLEPGESVRDAAIRELREETGLVLAPTSSRPFTLARSNGCPRPGFADHDHWTFGFRFESAADYRQLVTEPDQPARWFSFDELPADRFGDIDVVLDWLGR